MDFRVVHWEVMDESSPFHHVLTISFDTIQQHGYFCIEHTSFSRSLLNQVTKFSCLKTYLERWWRYPESYSSGASGSVCTALVFTTLQVWIFARGPEWTMPSEKLLNRWYFLQFGLEISKKTIFMLLVLGFFLLSFPLIICLILSPLCRTLSNKGNENTDHLSFRQLLEAVSHSKEQLRTSLRAWWAIVSTSWAIRGFLPSFQ